MTGPGKLKVFASELSRELTDTERIALGLELIQTAKDPDNWAALRCAASMINEQADGLFVKAFNKTTVGPSAILDEPAAPHLATLQAKTTPEPLSRDARPREHPLRAVWRWAVHLERRLSNSPVGDFLALVCLVGLFIALIFMPGDF